MSSAPISGTITARAPRSGIFPRLLYVHGAEQKELQLGPMPFTIGRKTGKDLEIPDPRVSRDHAEIVCEDGVYYVTDGGSKLGTFVNKERITTKHKLVQGDRIEFGIGVGAQLIFDPPAEQSIVAREFLSQISSVKTEKANDLEKLALFLDAARKLNTAGALDEILLTLIGTTLKLTHAERGFIFLRQANGELVLAAGCTDKGERLTSDETISHSVLVDASKSASEFMITDTLKSSEMASRQSIVAQSLKTVIAIPLRKAHSKDGEDPVLGVLYMDSRFASGSLSSVSTDILKVIAREAAALVESTHLAQAEEAGRRYQQELSIAAQIQQRLMAVTIPELSFASLSAKNLPCKDIGGDFFDVVVNEDGLTIVVTDVSGKGISAAIMASILQGLIYAQVVARVPLPEIISSANRFLCQKVAGEKYATAVILRLSPDGKMEVLNCGHVPPLIIANGQPKPMKEGNLPVGLLPIAEYSSVHVELNPGDRVILVTDGVTEAEDAAGEMFGEDRLQEAAIANDGPCFDHIFASIRHFCGDVPLNDDCTLLELVFRGKSKNATDSGVNL